MRAAAHAHRALERAVEPGRDAQQRALSAAAGAHEADDLAGRDAHAYIVEDATRAVALDAHLHVERGLGGRPRASVGVARPLLAVRLAEGALDDLHGASTVSRQRSSRRSSRAIAVSLSLPSSASSTMAASTRSARLVSRPSVSR